MSRKTFETCPIRPGFDWAITLTDPKPEFETDELTGDQVEVDPLFPDGASYIADVKQHLDKPMVGQITTADGNIVRIDGSNLEITIPATITELLDPNKLARFDIVRIDGPGPQHLNIELTIPVQESITAPPPTGNVILPN